MAVSPHSVISFNSVQVSGSSVKFPLPKIDHVSASHYSKSSWFIRSNRRRSHLCVAESDRAITDRDETSNVESTEDSSLKKGAANDSKQENKTSSPSGVQKKASLTARERLRAARVMNRYSEAKPSKSEMGRSVLDALRESDKGKKGLPQAPTNLFDDSKRGMPKPGLTFDFPGGLDLFLIALSFVVISTIMFATTYLVWKVGAIHYNEY